MVAGLLLQADLRRPMRVKLLLKVVLTYTNTVKAFVVGELEHNGIHRVRVCGLGLVHEHKLEAGVGVDLLRSRNKKL